jgi:hypothetical protein
MGNIISSRVERNYMIRSSDRWQIRKDGGGKGGRKIYKHVRGEIRGRGVERLLL